jgi:hypothetical protein
MDRITAKTLRGGHLATVMAARMPEDDAVRKKFTRKVGKPNPKVLGAYEKMYGWRPPAELSEWEGASSGYDAIRDEVSDVWMIGGSIAYASSKKKPTVDKLMADLDGSITLFAGLELFGMDPSGDRCFVSTIPHALDCAEVHVYNHENGEMDGTLYYSIGDFVFSNWGEEDKKVMNQFNGDMKSARKKLSPLEDPRALFNRMKWMWSLPTGEPGYRFAEDMDRAPTFADWENEKKLLAKMPWLANYWMLAHYFLGNAEALADAVVLAKKVPGETTKALAALLAKGKIGKLKPKQLDELKQAVRKNADENLLEPAARARTSKERSAGIQKANPKDIAARLKKGEDGWTLIAEFPDDVETHDAILKSIAKKEKAFAKTLERYMQQRAEDDIWDKWPSEYSDEEIDKRLSPAIGAAFRAGLKFDSDHKRASSSLVNTLRHLDDDVAMDAFAAAIEACRMDDPRLEYVVGALRDSKHSRAKAILNRGAWRFFEFFEQTKKSMKKTADEGPTLDNMFRVHSYLLGALIASIRIGDEEAEKLTDKVCSFNKNMMVLGIAFAVAFRLIGEKKLTRHVPLAFGYCAGVDGLDGEFLADEAKYNVAEAAIAAAKLEPEKAEKLLRAMLAKKREHEEMRLDVIGAILGGLLVVAPNDPELLEWTERILGNRTESERVYGTLRGIAEAKVRAAKEWVPWHVWVGCGSIDIGSKPAINRAARAALVAIGEPEPPPFDEEDEYGSDLEPKQLAGALLEPGKYHASNIFEKIVDEEVRSPEVVENGGRLLADLFRFSADDPDRASDDTRYKGMSAMILQGTPALPALAPLLELPHMGGSEKTVVLYTMSIITDVPALFARLAKMKDDEVLALLAKPDPESIGAIDILAGWAFAKLGAAAESAIEQALRWRWSLVSPSEYDCWVEHDPTAARLARVAARIPKCKSILADLKKAIDSHYAQGVIERALAEKPKALETDARVLEQKMLADEQDGPRYTAEIGKTLKWVGERIYFQSIVKDQRYEQTGAIDPQSADAIARSLVAIGFTSRGSAKTRGPRS